MSFVDIRDKVTSKMGRQILVLQKHSPKILFIAGTVGVVATAVLAVRATLKVDDILEEHEERMKDVETVLESEDMDYSEEDAQKDRALVYVKTAGNLAKLYAPAIVIGVASIAALTGSHFLLTNRLNGAVAAYTALDKGFRAYRQRVIDELGPQKDAEFRYGTETKEIVEEGPNGPEVTTVKVAAEGHSIYARWFDESCSSWSRQYGQNQFFIQCQQNWANDRLQARGHLFLNEVYDMLGIPRTKEGAVVGWLKEGKAGAGDGKVDFGIFRNNEFTVTRWLNQDERSILLDFNVDGVIYDKI